MSALNSRQRAGIGMTSLRTRRRLVDRLHARGIDNETVLAAILDTPRHLFIEEALAHRAYEDTALPIGYNQTISQPFIVALMSQLMMENRTQIADMKQTDQPPLKKVLEIGTGCGYQTAVLSQLVTWVFSVERIVDLQVHAKQRLAELGYRNVSYLDGDGFLGWSSNQPFDGILVTAAPPAIPLALLQQLAVGGRLVIPVGGASDQSLRLVTRTDSGYEEEVHEAVHFVPMLKGRKI